MALFPSKCNFRNNDYGCLIWGKVPGSRIWPGMIVKHSECGLAAPHSDQTVCLFWFGDNRVSMGMLSKTYNFVKYFCKYFSKNGPALYLQGIEDILQECCERANVQSYVKDNYENLIDWAHKGFKTEDPTKIVTNIVYPEADNEISLKVQKHLHLIEATQISLQNKDDFLMENLSSDSDTDEREVWKPKAKILNAVRKGTMFLESICISCEKDETTVVIAPHPYFQGSLCKSCKETLELVSAALQNQNDRDFVCAVCYSPGELILCDNEICDKLYCVGCIELFVAPSAVEKIKKTDPWMCFLCTEYNSSTHGLLIPKSDWQKKTLLQQNSRFIEEKIEEFEEVFTFKPTSQKQPIRVLSLFDGIGTGYYTLQNLDISVEAYFASEIHEDAVNITKMNFGNSITHLGDILCLSDAEVKKLCPIDLLIGGSPCNDLSFVNPNRKGLYDPTGTGILFFHYFRIQKLIQIFNGERHLFWLYENVSHMQKEFKDHISRFLQKLPIVIDAKHFSAQHRPRNFWGNIPGMSNPLPVNEQSHSFNSVLSVECNRSALVETINCVTTNRNSLRVHGGNDLPVIMNGKPDIPWITEIEKVFGFPKHYTDVGNLGIRERQAVLGRSWSVPVVRHILSPLREYFLLKED